MSEMSSMHFLISATLLILTKHISQVRDDRNPQIAPDATLILQSSLDRMVSKGRASLTPRVL